MPSITQDIVDAEKLDASAPTRTDPTLIPAITQKNTIAHQQLEQQQLFAPAQRTQQSYGTIFHSVGGGSIGFMPTTSSNSTAFEQYRLQLYNYALNIERLRCPQYSAAAAMAAAYANNSGGSSINGYGQGAATAAGAGYIPTNGGGGASGRLALSMSLFPQRIFQPDEPKPQHSYIGLIAMAILSSTETKLVLSDIYQYILDNYAYFRTRGPGWRNSIRHNLSLNDCFIKSGRSANGKGHYWAIHPANMEDFQKGDFRRRKAQRKVRKHMGLTVDDAGTDSPSPPPLDLTASPPLTVVAHTHHQLAAAQQLATFGYLQQQRQQHQQHHHHHQQLHQHPHHQPSSHQQQLYQQTQNYIPPYAAHIVSPTVQIQPHHDNSINNSSSNNQQQHSLHQHPHPFTSNTNQLAFINETTTTTASVIANLYSQSRKRQFDVASLLAPDVVKVVDIVGGDVGDIEPSTAGITTTQHTVITKVSVQHQHHHHHHQQHLPATYHQQLQQLPSPLPPAANSISRHLIDLELDEQEDIDVVASDDVLAEDAEDHEHQQQHREDDELFTDVSYADNNSLHSSLDAATNNEEAATNSDSRSDTYINAALVTTPPRLMEDEGDGCQRNSSPPAHLPECIVNDSTTSTLSCNNRSPPVTATVAAVAEQHRHSVQQLMLQHFQQQPQAVLVNSNSNELNGMDPHIFGRYYSTYMAAAAARRIGAMQLKLQPHTPPPHHNKQEH